MKKGEKSSKVQDAIRPPIVQLLQTCPRTPGNPPILNAMNGPSRRHSSPSLSPPPSFLASASALLNGVRLSHSGSLLPEVTLCAGFGLGDDPRSEPHRMAGLGYRGLPSSVAVCVVCEGLPRWGMELEIRRCDSEKRPGTNDFIDLLCMACICLVSDYCHSTGVN